MDDARFSKLYDSHLFALDPTDPRYKDVSAADVIAKERDARRRRKEKDASSSLGKKKTVINQTAEEDEATKEKKRKSRGDAELSAMVAGLKRKQARAT